MKQGIDPTSDGAFSKDKAADDAPLLVTHEGSVVYLHTRDGAIIPLSAIAASETGDRLNMMAMIAGAPFLGD